MKIKDDSRNIYRTMHPEKDGVFSKASVSYSMREILHLLKISSHIEMTGHEFSRILSLIDKENIKDKN